MEESIDIPVQNGRVKLEDVISFLEQLGASRSASLHARLTELREEMEGTHAVEEAIPALFAYVDRALSEVVVTLAGLELAAKSDGQPRDVTVNLVEE